MKLLYSTTSLSVHLSYLRSSSFFYARFLLLPRPYISNTTNTTNATYFLCRYLAIASSSSTTSPSSCARATTAPVSITTRYTYLCHRYLYIAV